MIALKKIPLVRSARRGFRSWRAMHVDRREGNRLFENPDVYVRALRRKGDETTVLHARDGLNITIRQNLWDARIVREIFVDKPYVRHVSLRPNPTVVDVGGYIGDFCLYAVKYLDAERVIVYEPTAENFEILRRNVEDNGYGDRIVAVNEAVSDSGEVVLNLQILDGEEVHVSSYLYGNGIQRKVPAVTLSELLVTHALDTIDLLKVDCEGGEYDILPEVPGEVLDRIENIVFEYHRVDDFRPKLERVLKRLRSADYVLRMDGNIVSASRA